MKKFLSYFIILAAAMCFMTSCSKTSSPGNAFKSYMEKLQAGDYKGFVEGFAVDETKSVEEQEQTKQTIEAMLTEKTSKSMAEKGGLKDVQILEETIAEDGKTATIQAKMIYGNGEEQENTQKMVKQGDEWKMELNK